MGISDKIISEVNGLPLSDKFISEFKRLPIQQQLEIFSELTNVLTDSKKNTLDKHSFDELLPISNDILAIKGHTLDMCVKDNFGKDIPIYNHLAIFKNDLLKEHANNNEFLKDFSVLSDKIKNINLHASQVNHKEKKNIKDRTIIAGDQIGNQGGFSTSGVKDLTYLRNEKLKHITPIKQIIEEIKGYGLSEDDAGKLIVIIKGLPKGGNNSDGKRINVGIFGYYSISAEQCGGVETFWFNDSKTGIYSSSSCYAIPSLTYSYH